MRYLAVERERDLRVMAVEREKEIRADMKQLAASEARVAALEQQLQDQAQLRNPRGNTLSRQVRALSLILHLSHMLGLGALHQCWVMHMLHRYQHMYREVNGMILVFQNHHYLMILCINCKKNWSFIT